jgi:DNA-binding beta-propeller fold protein YncE
VPTRLRILSVVLVTVGFAALAPGGSAATTGVGASSPTGRDGPRDAAAEPAPPFSFSGLVAPFGFGSALVGSAPVGDGPSLLAVDPATHTIYVTNGMNNNGPAVGGDTVSVIDARHCNAQDVSRCSGPWATITVGNRTPGDLPSGVAIDQATDTVYVTNFGDNTVSVFNGATCNAEDTDGCAQTPAEVPVGPGPLWVTADPANHTVYVANNDNGAAATVSMIDSATCTATDLAACPTSQPPTVSVPSSPFDVEVNQTTHTVYVAVVGGESVFDADTCNAIVQTGCGTMGQLAGDPNGDDAGVVDEANDTLYTANYDNTISVFDLSRCDAGDLTGCATDSPGTVAPWPDPPIQEEDLYIAVDQSLHSVYVSYQKDAALVVVDTDVCNGSHLAACATLDPPTVHTGADPQGVIVDPSTQTLYTANQVDDDVSVINATRCNAGNVSGCRHPEPSIPIPAPGALATDDAVHTTYIVTGTDGTVAMLDTERCNAYQLFGCGQAPPTLTVGEYPSAVAIDPLTDTVYVASSGSGTTGIVSVFDDRTCNASDQAGCAAPRTLIVPGYPDGITINTTNDTLYVTTITASGPNLISVFNGATCNATHAGGCAQTPARLEIGDSGDGNSDVALAINQQTNTLYATNVDYASQDADTVYVFNGASCDAVKTNGCSQTPATVTVGDDPRGVVVDPATNSVYVVNHAAGDFAASVSVINGATCDGTNHAGCGQTPATTAAGLGAINATIDPTTQQVYVTDLQDAGVTVINGSSCNALDTAGCSQPPAEDAVGNYPLSIALDPGVDTIYVSNNDNVSAVPETP